MVNFKIFDVTAWTTINFNAQYLKKKKQPGNEIWPINRAKNEIYFS